MQSGHRRDKLYRIINHWLHLPPPSLQRPFHRYHYLIFDGTFLGRPAGLVALMDGLTKEILGGQYGVLENSPPQLVAFLSGFRDQGLQPRSCTVDGNPQAIRALRQVWPDIIIQRCLVHIQRQGLSWCRINPKTTPAQKLRALFLKVGHIRTPAARDQFLDELSQWEQSYGQRLAHQPERGWVLSDLKRARSMLLKALPDMFHYLEDVRIPSTTNGLEGYFSRLKSHYRQHRGLSPHKRLYYFAWYFYYKPK